MKRKIYIVGGDYTYANWCEADIVRRMEDATIVMFTGGSDVTPALYNKTPHPTTSTSWERDKREVIEFRRARELNIPMIGICRGAQFLCVMAGGTLVQHQSHPYLHKVKTSDDREIVVTSTHHQRAYIKNIPPYQVELLAWAIDRDGERTLSPFSFGENNKDDLSGEKEVEIAFYKDIRALGIQSHPEFCYPAREDWEHKFIEYCRELVGKYLDD